MLQLHDLNNVKIKGLKEYKDYKVESDLSSGDKILSFLYPARLSKEIVEECYIRTKTDEFVVKEINNKGDWKTIVAKLNVEDLEGKAFEHFDTSNETITACLNLALAGTGWTLGTCDVTRRRTVRKTNSSSWEIIQEAKKNYRVELEFNTLAKKINIFDKRGSDKGVYFSDTLNLRDIDIQGNSYDFYTKIIAIGKDDIKVTLDNFQYSNKVKTFIWKDDRYTDINALREDAAAKLNEISKPYRSYSADVIDLANTSEKYKILNYELGDTITIVSKEKYLKEKQRIVKMIEYPEESERNSCEIANITLRFENIQKEFKDTSDTVDNITKDDGTVDGSTVDGITSSQITDFEASVGKITDLTVVNAKIENLYAEKASVGQLNAVIANIGELNATKANITDLNAINVKITNLQADKANITDLNAVNAKITVLEAETANIKNLLAGNITGENIQAGGITSDKLTIQNGFITNAMIANLDVSKINAGDISTNKFRIISDSGNMLIADNTIQISDISRVRVQIGKDASNDYNMYVWDATGKLMFDATGLKADGIKGKIIRDDMVSDTANIDGGKLNISSVVTSINNGVTTIKSSKVNLDGLNQSLEVAFNSLKTQADGTKSLTESNSTTIGVMQGQITTAINNTQIIKDGQTILLKDDYNRTVQTVNSINSTIGSHTSSINELTGKVVSVDTKVNSVKRDLDGTISTVSGHTSNINGLNSSVSSHSTQIAQLKGEISLKVEQTDIDKSVKEIKVGIKNILKDSGKQVTSTEYNIKNYATYIDLKPNTKYTVAFKGVCDSRTKFNIHWNGGNINAKTFEKTSDGYYTAVITTPAVITRHGINFYNIPNTPGASATLEWVCLYEGDVKAPFDFTPATEDTDKAIADTVTITEEKITQAKAEIKVETNAIKQSVSSVDSKVTTTTVTANNALTNANTANDKVTTLTATVTQTNNKVASIETNLNSITSRVSATESTTVTLNGKITSAETRITSAEQKITSTAIVNTINESINNGTTSINTVTTILDRNGFTIKNGAITILNKANVGVLKADTSGNLTLNGSFQQWAPSGKKSVGIENNVISLYDWELAGDIVGKLYAGRVPGWNAGYLCLYGDTGNPLYLGCGSTTGIILADNTVQQKTPITFVQEVNTSKNIDMLDYAALEFYGIDYPTIVGSLVSTQSRDLFLASKEFLGSVNIGYLNQSETGYYTTLRASKDSVTIWGSLTVTGAKNRAVDTKFGVTTQNAYETSSPYFGDIGEGIIAEDGLCYVFIDPVMMETINTKCSYQVFLQNYGAGESYILERNEDHFLIKGTQGLRFAWEIKARQKGYENDRLEIKEPLGPKDDYVSNLVEPVNDINYEEKAITYLDEYRKEIEFNEC